MVTALVTCDDLITLLPISPMSLMALSPTTWPPYRMDSGLTEPRMLTSDLRTMLNLELVVIEAEESGTMFSLLVEMLVVNMTSTGILGE